MVVVRLSRFIIGYVQVADKAAQVQFMHPLIREAAIPFLAMVLQVEQEGRLRLCKILLVYSAGSALADILVANHALEAGSRSVFEESDPPVGIITHPVAQQVTVVRIQLGGYQVAVHKGPDLGIFGADGELRDERICNGSADIHTYLVAVFYLIEHL